MVSVKSKDFVLIPEQRELIFSYFRDPIVFSNEFRPISLAAVETSCSVIADGPLPTYGMAAGWLQWMEVVLGRKEERLLFTGARSRRKEKRYFTLNRCVCCAQLNNRNKK